MVTNNINSALILEDDVDWDIRIRDQLRDFATASLILNSRASDIDNNTSSIRNTSEPIHFEDILNPPTPHLSPYGDHWDVLWFGHLGQRMPRDDEDSKDVIYRSYVVQHNDSTVAQYSQQWSMDSDFWNIELRNRPDYTRLYHSSIQGVGTQGYAISLNGARHALYSLNTEVEMEPIDIALRMYCQNEHGHGHRLCLTTSPSLFSQYKNKGDTSKDSNINSAGGGFRENGRGELVRWSARTNLPKLLEGRKDFEDTFPDREDGREWTEWN